MPRHHRPPAARCLGPAGALTLACFAAVAPPAAAQPNTSGVDGGVATFRGERFFPRGFYLAETVEDLRAGRGLGFNTATVTFRGSFPLLDGLVAEAERLGLGLLVETESENVLADRLVRRYRDSPALFAWGIEDDSDDRAFRSFEQVRQKAIDVRAADPDHLTYASATGFNRFRRAEAADWSGLVDLPGHQSYPIDALEAYDEIAPGRSDLENAYQQHRLYADAAGDAPSVANVQAFAWEQEGGERPTAEEVRNMTYGALIAGVDGVLFFSLPEAQEDPDFLASFGGLAAELAALEAAVLDGAELRFDDLSTGVHAAVRGSGEDAVLLAVSTQGPGELSDFSLALPEGFLGVAPLFPGAGGTLGVSGGLITGQLAGGSAVAYRLVVPEPAGLAALGAAGLALLRRRRA